MFYAISCSDGYYTVLTNWKEVESIYKKYPYAKCRKFRKEENAWEFLRKNVNNNTFGTMECYGNIFDKCHIKMRFLIGDNCVYYTFKTSNIGYVKIEHNEALISYSGDLINVVLPNTKLGSTQLISSQMLAIYHGLKIIGPYLDVDIQLHDMSTYYALTVYEGDDVYINRTKELIDNRFANVAYTLGKERFLL